jgi:hypothetical protein
MTEQTLPGNTYAELPPAELASLFADLVNELIPGGDGWPPAATVGAQGLVVARLIENGSETDLLRIVTALIAAGGPFSNHGPEERVAIVHRFETQEPQLFEQVRSATTLAYYENPFVAERIRKLGRPYSLRPHATGYPMAPFDFERDRPPHQRGSYQTTEAVRSLDISGLKLDDNRTENWGLKR